MAYALRTVVAPKRRLDGGGSVAFDVIVPHTDGLLSRYDFSAQRLYVDDALAPGATLAATPEAFNYLVNVLRLREGDAVLLFNGRDGEFRARLASVARRGATLQVEQLSRAQTRACDLDYAFAPLKHARLDYMAQKAAEMGAGRLVPVITRRTQARRVNLERLRANAIEAAEQCGLLTPPTVAPEVDLAHFLRELAPGRLLVFCDEDAEIADPVAALRAAPQHKGVTLLIGPEGGFDEAERDLLMRASGVLRLSLGPRILRADTAAVAALALIQSTIGDVAG